MHFRKTLDCYWGKHNFDTTIHFDQYALYIHSKSFQPTNEEPWLSGVPSLFFIYFLCIILVDSLSGLSDTYRLKPTHCTYEKKCL